MPGTLLYSMRAEPPQLNSMKTSDLDSGFVLGHVMEGLTRYGMKNDGSVVPGVAEKWTLTSTRAVFHLRKNARWSDGKPVTAQDFVFAWQTAIAPETASQYAFILFPVKNAEAIQKGEKPATALGVQAKDDHTLEVTLERPCPYFVGLTAFPTYFPVRKDFYSQRKSKYASEASELLYNGPFKLTEWIHGARIVMEKNDRYWDAATVKIARIDIPYITADGAAKYNFFKDKKIDVLVPLDADQLARAQGDQVKVQSHLDGGVWFIEFNVRNGRPTANKNLRQAISLAFGPRVEFTSKVIATPGARSALSLIPSSAKGIRRPFLKEYPIRSTPFDIKKARQHLELAKKELGGSIPPLTLLVNQNTRGDREAEYFQQLFKTQLGLEIKIDKQVLKQRLAKMNAGDFDLASTNWSPDYADPMTYAELKASWSRTNRGRWENAEYDRLIRAAQAESDPAKRMKAMAQANQLLLDEAAILPTYESMILWAQSPKVQGVIRRTFGPDPDFRYASLK